MVTFTWLMALNDFFLNDVIGGIKKEGFFN